MDFTLQFITTFGVSLFYAAPLLLFLVLLTALLGQVIGRREGGSPVDALYYPFITATTAGYGDFHPRQNAGKFGAIAIALLGLVLTGIVVALGVKAAGPAFEQIHDVDLEALAS